MSSLAWFHGFLILNDGPKDPEPGADYTPGGSSLTPFIFKNDVFRFSITLDLDAVDGSNYARPNSSGGITTEASFSDIVKSFSLSRDPGNRGSFDPSSLRYYLTGPFSAALTVTDANMGPHPEPGLDTYNEHVHIYIPLLAADHSISPFDSIYLNLYNGNLYANPGSRQYMLDTSVEGTPFTFGDIFLRSWTDLANFQSQRYLEAKALVDAVFIDNFRSGDALDDGNGPIGSALHGHLAIGGTVRLIPDLPPKINKLGTVNADGSYGLGARITITLQFSQKVFVDTQTGIPSLLLETGATDRSATYYAGSGTDTLSFIYTVQAGDTSTDLDIAASNALSLNGGSIRGAIGQQADLALPAPGATGSLAANAALVVNGVLPQNLVISTATPIVKEGASLAVALRSDTLAAGASVYWQFSGTGIAASDFSPSELRGSISLGSDRRAAFSRSVSLDLLAEGDEQLTLEFFSDPGLSKSLGKALFTIQDVAPVTLAGATDGRDLLIGTASDEVINGVPVGSVLNGRGSYDTLTGNGGNDLFILGTASAVFYDDGISTSSGATDLAAITDFTAGDRIQLHGTATEYRLASGRVSGSAGVMLYRLNPSVGSTPGATDELIGFIKGLTPANLNLADSSQFLYV